MYVVRTDLQLVVGDAAPLRTDAVPQPRNGYVLTDLDLTLAEKRRQQGGMSAELIQTRSRNHRLFVSLHQYDQYLNKIVANVLASSQIRQVFVKSGFHFLFVDGAFVRSHVQPIVVVTCSYFFSRAKALSRQPASYRDGSNLFVSVVPLQSTPTPPPVIQQSTPPYMSPYESCASLICTWWAKYRETNWSLLAESRSW